MKDTINKIKRQPQSERKFTVHTPDKELGMLLQTYEDNPIKKRAKDVNRIFYKRRYRNDQYAYESIFKISHQGNENENISQWKWKYSEKYENTVSYLLGWLKLKGLKGCQGTLTHVGKNKKWYNFFEEMFGSFLFILFLLAFSIFLVSYRSLPPYLFLCPLALYLLSVSRI